MSRHVDRVRVRQAKLSGSVQRLRALVTTEPEAFERLREAWPDMVERIEHVVELVDWEGPGCQDGA